MDYEAYINFSDDQSRFSVDEREHIYSFALQYQKWLDDQKLHDENDISRMALREILNGELDKYDLIVCDEVQDLTEMQINMLFHFVRDETSLLFSGDIHQIVNPTYFRFDRIKTLFLKKDINYNEKQLKKNYRSQEKIVKLANDLTDIRKIKIGNLGFDDYKEQFIRLGNKPFLLNPSQLNEKSLIEIVKERHYARIVVPDEQEKKFLENKLSEKDIIFTVQDIKGLEYQYIVCYNLITKHSDIWEEIFSGCGKHSAKHRYYFNLLYVAITRAKENLCLYEEDQNNSLLQQIIDHFEQIDVFDEEKLALEKLSTRDDWKKDAEYLEQNEKYAEAMKSYKKAFDDIGVKRCEAKQLELEGNFEKAGDIMLEIQEYEYAIDYFKRVDNKAKQLKTMISSYGYEFMDIDQHFQNQNIGVLELFLDNKEFDNEYFSIFIENYLKPKLGDYNKRYGYIKTLIDQGINLSTKGNIL